MTNQTLNQASHIGRLSRTIKSAAAHGYVSEYLRQPRRSTPEAQQQEAAQPDSEAEKEPQQQEG
jgi:hypothetical protein